jgi:hypothetical protein
MKKVIIINTISDNFKTNLAMTELLERAISQLKTLPVEDQDAIATRLLAEIEDEQIWKTKFEATTDEQWDNLAAMVRQEITMGDITPLNHIFPSGR